MTNEKLRELLLKAYNSGFDDGVAAVQMSIEDGLDDPNGEDYHNGQEVVDNMVKKLK